MHLFWEIWIFLAKRLLRLDTTQSMRNRDAAVSAHRRVNGAGKSLETVIFSLPHTTTTFKFNSVLKHVKIFQSVQVIKFEFGEETGSGIQMWNSVIRFQIII